MPVLDNTQFDLVEYYSKALRHGPPPIASDVVAPDAHIPHHEWLPVSQIQELLHQSLPGSITPLVHANNRYMVEKLNYTR